MAFSTVDKILIKALRQGEAVGRGNSLLSFLSKPGLVWFELSYTESQCHRLSGEELRQQDKNKTFDEHMIQH